MSSKNSERQQRFRKSNKWKSSHITEKIDKDEDFQTFYNQGMRWSRYRECEAAIERFNIAIRLNPDFADTYFQRGFMYYYICALQRGDESNLDLAVNDFDQAIRLAPDHLNAYNFRIRTNNLRRAYDAMIADCQMVMAHWPDINHGPYLVDMADAYQAIGDYDQAIHFHTIMLEHYPNDSRRYYWRSQVYMLQGNYAAALADGERIIELDPDHHFGYLVRGDACEALHDLSGAIENYRHTLILRPENDNIKRRLSELELRGQ
jgi:tetratricopeptide (TPR) repeat protein